MGDDQDNNDGGSVPTDQATESWAKKHGATLALWIFLMVDAAGAGTVICKAHHATQHDDFWSVAIPGVSTGAGTLALAAVTVWLARYQARRDTANRIADDAARSTERVDAESKRAMREARKVIAVWKRRENGSEDIQITNAGRETIVEVFLDEATAEPPDQPGHKWEWTAKGLEGMVFQGRDYDWYRPYVAPGDTQDFAGWMSHMHGGRISNAKVDDHKRFIKIIIAWTDPAGNQWTRSGYNEPQLSDTAYQPRPPLGLEDAEDQVVSSAIRRATDNTDPG